MNKKLFWIIALIIIALGIITGYILFVYSGTKAPETVIINGYSESYKPILYNKFSTNVEVAQYIKPIYKNKTNTDEIIFNINTNNYEKWNEAKGCYDISNSKVFKEVYYDESLNGVYDPNWLIATEMSNGCTLYMHPNQGHDNQYDERG